MAHKVKTDEIAAADRAAYALERKNKAKKLTVVLTYLFALTCLLAGLLVPLYGYESGGDLQSMMLLRHLPRMVNSIVAIIPAEPLKNGVIPSSIPWFGEVMTETYSFDIFSLFSVLYTLLCLFAIVMLLPVCLGKKEKNTSAGCAFFIEVLGLLLTLAYAAAVFYYAFIAYIGTDMNGKLVWSAYNFLIPMGGLLIAAVLQSIATKGGIGISKTLGFVLALAGVFVLFDLAMLFPTSSTNLDHFSSFLKAGDTRAFVTVEGEPILGFYGVVMLIDIVNTIETIVSKATSGGTNGIFSVIILVLLVFTTLMVLFNLFCDTIGLGTGKKYKRDRSPAKNGASNGFALARYVATLILAFLLFVMVLITILVNENRADAAVPGIYLYALIVIVVLQLVNAAFRTAVANRRYKKGKLAPAAASQEVMVIEDPAFAEPEPQPEPAYAAPAEYAQPAEAEPVAYAEPAPAYEEQPAPVAYEQPTASEEIAPAYTEYAQPEPAYEEPVAYAEPLYDTVEPQPAEPKVNTVYIYSGDTDEFLDTLTDKEKYEFVDVFLKKSQGSISGVPEYHINEDNSDFFPAVFVHINRYRNVVSDALMSKMYKQLGKM